VIKNFKNRLPKEVFINYKNDNYELSALDKNFQHITQEQKIARGVSELLKTNPRHVIKW
jgi:hypothetical protein